MKDWRIFLGCGLLWLLPFSAAQANDEALEAQLRDYLLAQMADQAGSVEVEINLPGAAQSACRHPEPFLPGNGARPWGRTTVGVRCPGDRPETRYYQAYVAVNAPYYVAARTLNAGDVIALADLQTIEGDLTRLPSTIATDASTLVGMAASRRIGEGMPITTSMVKAETVVKRGDTVRITAQGAGFAITSEGKALNDAPLGGDVRVRTQAGSIVLGISQGTDQVVVKL